MLPVDQILYAQKGSFISLDMFNPFCTHHHAIIKLSKSLAVGT
jgi:hypothetical protein